MVRECPSPKERSLPYMRLSEVSYSPMLQPEASASSTVTVTVRSSPSVREEGTSMTGAGSEDGALPEGERVTGSLHALQRPSVRAANS